MRKRTSNRFGWRKVNEVGKKMRSLRKYHFGDNAVLIMKLLTKIAEKEKEKIKVLDFGCAEGTICLRETKPFIEYFGYDNDVENPKVAYHSLDEMKGCHFDAIVFSHVVEHLELDEMVSIMEWSLDRSDYIISDYIIVMTPRAEYPFNDFWATIDHKKPYDNEMFLAYLDIIGWETLTIITLTGAQDGVHLEWQSQDLYSAY